MKFAIVINSAPDDLSRGYRALMTAKEFREGGDDVTIVFDGAGTETLAAFADPDHKVNGLLESVRGDVRGACGFCANSHGTKAAIETANFPLLTDYNGHASIRTLAQDGYQIINY